MIDSIEKIDWETMPEGAEEFSLETKSLRFTWYKDNRELFFHLDRRAWLKDSSPDNRPLHKVSDHHPDMPRKEWDGKGQPWIGSKVRVDLSNYEIESDLHGQTGTVIARGTNSIGIKMITIELDDQLGKCRAFVLGALRAPKTPRQQWIEQAMSLGSIDPSEWAGAIYDALKSGALKPPVKD